MNTFVLGKSKVVACMRCSCATRVSSEDSSFFSKEAKVKRSSSLSWTLNDAFECNGWKEEENYVQLGRNWSRIRRSNRSFNLCIHKRTMAHWGWNGSWSCNRGGNWVTYFQVKKNCMHAGVTFHNEECEKHLQKYLASRNDDSSRLFRIGHRQFRQICRKAIVELKHL